jgi:hypothetical protein
VYPDIIVNSTYKFHPHFLSMTEVCEMAQNDNYCTETNLLGPIFSSDPLNRSNHIYFFADHSEFDIDTYEYHETVDSLSRGFIFALFSMRGASMQEIEQQLEQSKDSSMAALAKGECQEQLRGLKVKKNLGSTIEKVGEFSLDGYTIRYVYGDICQSEGGEGGPLRYSSEVRYECGN